MAARAGTWHSTGWAAPTRRSRWREDWVEQTRAWGAPGEVGAALCVLGLVQRDEGIDTLREAVADAGGLVGPAGAREGARRARRRAAPRPQADGGARPAAPALELASACEAPGLVDHVRTELHATGARPRTDALAGVDALTPSERRVVDLAAAGGANREIAQQLYVTPKTVEVHLTNAYRKLGIRSRRELAGALS